MGPSAIIDNFEDSSTSVSNLSEGTYIFRCEVENSSGLKTYADARITVTVASPGADVARFNFNLTPQQVQGWVDISGGPLNQANNNRTWTDDNTGISVVNLSNSNLAWGTAFLNNAGNSNGSTILDPGGSVIPQNVLNSSWYSNNRFYVDQNSNQLKIAGLSPAKVYTIKIHGSIQASFNLDANPSLYVVNNNILNAKKLNAVGNTSNVVIFKGIIADSQGAVPLFIGVPTGEAQFGKLTRLRLLKILHCKIPPQ